MATKEQQRKLERQAFINKAKKRTAATAWKQNRTAKPGAGACNVDDGQYPCKITNEVSVGKKGKLAGHALVTLFSTVAEGDFEGQTGRQLYDLDREGGESQAFLVGDLKRLYPDREDEIEASENIADLMDLLDGMNENPPLALVTFTKNGQYTNTRIDELQGASDGSGSDDSGDADASDDSGDADASDDAGDDSGDDADGGYEPSVKDNVSYKVSGKPQDCVVLTVNRAKQTCTLKNKKTNTKYDAVAWDKITYEG